MITCQLFYSVFLIESFKEYGQPFIADDAILSWIGTVAAFCNGFAKFLTPTLLDYLPYKAIYKYILFFTLLQIVTIRYAVVNEYTFMASVAYIFAVDGSIYAMTPVLTLNIFGFNRGPEVYGVMQSATALASFMDIILI